MIDLTKDTANEESFCTECEMNTDYCLCDDFLCDEELDEEDDDDCDNGAVERMFNTFIKASTGVVLCLGGLLGSWAGVDGAGWLIFIGAMILL